MLEFDLRNLFMLLKLRNKAMSDMDFAMSQYYDSALSGCIYYIVENYLEEN